MLPEALGVIEDELKGIRVAVEKLAEIKDFGDTEKLLENQAKQHKNMIKGICDTLDEIMEIEAGSDTVFIRSSKIRKLIAELRKISE